MPQDSSISQIFTRFLRKVSKIKCPVCEEEFPDIEDRIKSHLQQNHPDILAGSDFGPLFQKIRKGPWEIEPKELLVLPCSPCPPPDVIKCLNADRQGNNLFRLASLRQFLQ